MESSYIPDEPSRSKALTAAIITSILGASLCSFLTSKIEGGVIFYSSIAIGYMVSFAVKYFGKGVDSFFGFIGCIFAAIGYSLSCIIFFWINNKSFGFTCISSDGFSFVDLILFIPALSLGYFKSFRNSQLI